jgi:hypothetical protein
LPPHTSRESGALADSESEFRQADSFCGIEAAARLFYAQRLKIDVMKTILESSAIERLAVNSVLALTLSLAAAANAVCLFSYL